MSKFTNGLKAFSSGFKEGINHPIKNSLNK